MKLRNTFSRVSDSALVAIVESVVLWFDLDARRPVVPAHDLRELWLGAPRTADFLFFEEKS